jgi:hypothetical protein
MASLLTSIADFCKEINLPLLLSVASSLVTGYFWLVKMNRERAGLRLYRVADFRADRLQCSDVPGMERATWYGEICLANPSTLPAAVISCQVQLFWNGAWRDGARIMEKKDDVPWLVEPLRVFTRSFGCSFNVEAGTPREQLSTPQRLRFLWTTVDGRQHTAEMHTRTATPVIVPEPSSRRAA